MYVYYLDKNAYLCYNSKHKLNKSLLREIMCKFGIIMVILSGFMGLLLNPEVLMASDSVTVTRLNDSNVVETIIPEPEPEPEPVYVASRVAAPVAGTVETYVAPDGITISGRTIPVYDVAEISESVGPNVYHYGKLYYGHNSRNVFGSLSDYGVGNTFTITVNGVTTTYRVAEVAMFEKNQDNGKLQIDGAGNYMKSVVNARGHSVALMTCAGTPLGNGRATHRLVVFADAI